MRGLLHSLFLAQVLGLYMFIMAIIMLSRVDYYRKMLTSIKPDSLIIILTASSGLMLGILLVLLHNFWLWQSEVLITIIAWLILIKSLLWLACPEYMAKLGSKVYAGWGYYAATILTGIIGMILISHGFYLFL